MKTVYRDYEECDYCFVTYQESDTGYMEYGCELLGSSCGEDCPITCRYEVED